MTGSRPIITLTTDFGTADGYVGAVKGALHSRLPGVEIVDITHEVPPHDVLAGAFALASAAPFFPDGTVHMAVVDPGVGGSRRAVVASTKHFHFVGPDNGLLVLAAEGARSRLLAHVPAVPEAIAPTFHGRDLFAPAAAHLAGGGDPESLGPPLAELIAVPMPPVERGAHFARGTIVHVDRFGNLVSSLRRAELPEGPLEIVLGGSGLAGIDGLVRYYAEAKPGTTCALIGSTGFLEIAVREGSARDRLGVGRGAEVVARKR